YLDYLVAYRGSGLVEYFLNDGTGNLNKAVYQPFLNGGRHGKFFVKDFDLDGDLDVFISGYNGDVLQNYLYLNDGAGGFTINDFTFPVTPRLGVAVGNFDGKGLDDFIFYGSEFNKATIYLNNIDLNEPPMVTNLVISGEALAGYD